MMKLTNNKLLKGLLFLISLLILNNNSYSQTKNLVGKVDNYLKELSVNNDFHLAIAVQKEDSIVYKKAFGYANWGHRVPNTVNTKFNIASIGKIFTAIEILKLKQLGLLELNKTVGHYIPNFPHKAIRDSVTIKSLLTHSSGLPLWFSTDFESSPKFQYKTLKDYLPLFDEINIDYSKKGLNSYSNVGYFVLGYIIEAIKKDSFEACVSNEIFIPNNLLDTDYWSLTAVIPNVATGYTRPINAKDFWKTNNHKNMGGGPAGGGYSTVIDLLNFYSRLRNNKVLDKEHTKLMFTPHIKTAYGHYGYGIGISKNNNQKMLGHLGGFYGIRGELMWYKDAGYTVAILSNTDQTDYADISYFIKIQLTGTEEQIEAYNFTQQLIKDLLSEIVEYNSLSFYSEELKSVSYDENLFEIKAYHYINLKEYEKAKTLLKMRKLLFPNSEKAKTDFDQLNKIINED